MSQTSARKLRTWSRFGQLRRVPSEYEIVIRGRASPAPEPPPGGVRGGGAPPHPPKL